MRARGRVLILLAFGTAAAGCGVPPSGGAGLLEATVEVDVDLVPAPEGAGFQEAFWLPGQDQILVALEPPSGRTFDVDLYTMKPDGSGLTRLPTPDDPDCVKTSRHFPRLLGDGRIGFVQRCWGTITGALNPARKLPEQEVSLMAYDPRTGRTEPLVPYYLPVNANGFDYTSDLALGIINDGHGLYERLHWIRPEGLVPIDLPLERAGNARFSPDGRTIALGGAPKGGAPRWNNPFRLDRTPSRLELPRTIYLMDVQQKPQLRPLVEGLYDNGPVEWSPDGRWLVLRLNGKRAPEGLWLVDVATGKRTLLVEGQVGWAAWPQDGRPLLVPIGLTVRYRESGEGPVGLYMIQLPDLSSLASR